MNNICRFCLNISNEEMCTISEGCDILRKFRSCFTTQITLNDQLPNNVCIKCFTKIEETYTFYQNINENEKKILQYLNNGINVIEYLHAKLKDNEKIKNECNDFKKKNFVKEYIINNDSDACSVEIKKENDLGLDTNNFIQDMEYSEDDDVTLASVKEHCNNEELKKQVTGRLQKGKLKNNRKKENKKPEKKQYSIFKNGISLDQFTCLTCFEILDSQLHLIKHYHDNHENKNNDNCFKYKIKDIGEDTSYICEICDRTCDKKRDILKHLTTHSLDRPFICKVCGRTYRTVTEIIRHGRAHNSHKLECSYQCGFSTSYKGALKDHEKRHQREPNYKFRCAHCNKGFFVRTWFEQHQNIHTGLKPYVCQLCGIAFHMERYLTSHKTTVHQQSSKVKKYVCVHCLHPCDSTKSLTEHLKEHGIKTEFLCDECGKIFKNSDKLRNHKNTHLQIKPFTCSICNKSFAKKFNLKLHEVAHTGERGHACAQCGKRYVQRSTLHRHCRRYLCT